MLKQIWTRCWARSPRETLGDILSDKKNRDLLAGISRDASPSDARTEKDAEAIIRYSGSSDYAAWAKEVFDSVVIVIDKLCRGDLADREADFYRGKLASYLDLLRLAHNAREKKIQLVHQRKAAKTVTDSINEMIR